MIVATAAFASPRSAGAVTRILRVSPSHPAMQFREDAGTTLIGNLIVGSPLMEQFDLGELSVTNQPPAGSGRGETPGIYFFVSRRL